MPRITRRPHLALAALSVAAAALSATAPASHAQIPGVSPAVDAASYGVVVGDQRVKLSVAHPDVTAGVVRVTVQNDTGASLTCSGFGGGATLTVTEAQIVARTVDHYQKFAVSPVPEVDVTGIPTQGTITIGLGSIGGLLPAAATNIIWPEMGSRSTIAGLYDAARINGHTGRQTGAVTVGARSSITVAVPLNTPSQGKRADFDAGAVLGCTIGGVNHVFSGYSPGTPAQTSGSLELPFLGRFGS